jgi:ferredoxin
VHITIDRERCIGAGQCVLAAPDVFTQDDEAIGQVLPGRDHGSDDLRIHEGAEACPVQAVKITED